MDFQLNVTPYAGAIPQPQAGAPGDTTELLRQMLEVQREQLQYVRATAAAHDMTLRWRAFLTRWQDEFPDLSESCRKVMPTLERAYARLITELSDHLAEVGPDGLDNEFGLQEFLDRFGGRLSQLVPILALVAPLTDAGVQSESSQ